MAYITKQQVADLLGVTTRTVNRYMTDGKIRAYKFGTNKQSAVLFDLEEITTFLNKNKSAK